MNVNIELEKLKETILLAAKFQGLSEEYLRENWHINYKINQDDEFIKMLSKLNEDMKLLNQAVIRDDLLTAKKALIGAKIYAQILMNFFHDIYDDIDRLCYGEELKDKWPKMIDNYQVPKDYDYEETNKPLTGDDLKQFQEIVKQLKGEK